MSIRLKRIYDKPSRTDGKRILVDRVWPRGVSKDQARLHRWMKHLAPTAELRQWFAHDPDKWEQFKTRYFRQLDEQRDTIAELAELASSGRVTLVYAAKDRRHNNAVALGQYLRDQYGV